MKDPIANSKILLIGAYPPPHGGVAVHIQTLRRQLLELGARVEVLNLGARQKLEKGVEPVWSSWRLVKVLVERIAENWLVHVHSSGHSINSWLVALAAAVIKRPLGIEPILTLHSGLVPAFLEMGERNRHIARAISCTFGKIIPVNEQICASLAKIGVSSRKTVVIPAAISLETETRDSPLSELIGNRYSPLVAASIADSAIYGVRMAILAIALIRARMPRTGLALFGPASAARIAMLAEIYNVKDRVLFFNNLEHEQAISLIRRSDLFLRPALADGDAISVREAIALGRPVLASNVGLRPDGVWLFKNNDPYDLAAKLWHHFTDPMIEKPQPIEDNSADGLRKQETNDRNIINVYREMIERSSRSRLRLAQNTN